MEEREPPHLPLAKDSDVLPASQEALSSESAGTAPPPTHAFCLSPLDAPGATLEHVGGKGASLARMAAAGLPVPPGFHITTAAYRSFVAANALQVAILAAIAAEADNLAELKAAEAASAHIGALFAAGNIPAAVAEAIRQGYAGLGTGSVAVAVRSSATAEDLPGMSFAGQQETYLNICGEAPLLEAVKRCWASLWTARAIGYRARQGIPPDDVSLAVVVQELVPASAAGILFTANPLTGARDQVMINAAWGLGEAIVGGLVTPDTVVVDKATGAVIQQDIADKTVMTVRTAEGTREEPIPGDRRTVAVLNPAAVNKLVQLGSQIEQLYGEPMDVEWAIRDDQLFVVQARPITALPTAVIKPAGEPVVEWKLPNPKGSYARSSVIELLPDPLSPLFATMALPAWNAAMAVLVHQLGFSSVMDRDMLTTINGYAYYDYGFTPAQNVRFALLTPISIGRITTLFRTARARWEDEARPVYATVVRRWEATDLTSMPTTQLLEGAQAILRQAALHYLTIQSGILPAAYMSESLFTAVYDRLCKRPGDPPALVFLLGYESTPIKAEQSLYDLAQWAHTQSGLAQALLQLSSDRIAAAYLDGVVPSSMAHGAWSEFRKRFAAHLGRFGHMIYDLDCAKAIPADDPAPLLETLKFFLSGQAADPYARLATAAAAREQATQRMLAGLHGARRTLFGRLLRLAQRFAPLREDALADVSLGWPSLRRMLREIGRRLAVAGSITTPDDIFWLTRDEAQAAATAIDANRLVTDLHEDLDRRRTTWEGQRSVTPPVTLPLKEGARFLGIDITSMLPAHTDQAAGDTIKGIGASPGRVTGTARVIHGPHEFNQMRHGDILVAKITTPAWTPLFALAGGVVTDVGGPLSHGSIVAREYHIPAVLGAGVATERIHSDQRITVDGDAGTVTVGG